MENSFNNRKLVECEIFSRVTGYYRPVHQYNKGKKEEFRLRKKYILPQLTGTKIQEKIIE